MRLCERMRAEKGHRYGSLQVHCRRVLLQAHQTRLGEALPPSRCERRAAVPGRAGLEKARGVLRMRMRIVAEVKERGVHRRLL